MQGTEMIYASIATSGFSDNSLQLIDSLTNDILYGRKDFNGFTLSEHAGLCKGGAPLIGASIVVSYARRSLAAGGNAESSTGSGTANWQMTYLVQRFYVFVSLLIAGTKKLLEGDGVLTKA